MTTQHTPAIAWTTVGKTGKNAGKTIPLWYPLDLSPQFAKRREDALTQIKAGTEMLEALNVDILKSISGSAHAKAVPEGHELTVSHRYGPAFTALPVKTARAKANAVKAA